MVYVDGANRRWSLSAACNTTKLTTYTFWQERTEQELQQMLDILSPLVGPEGATEVP